MKSENSIARVRTTRAGLPAREPLLSRLLTLIYGQLKGSSLHFCERALIRAHAAAERELSPIQQVPACLPSFLPTFHPPSRPLPAMSRHVQPRGAPRVRLGARFANTHFPRNLQGKENRTAARAARATSLPRTKRTGLQVGRATDARRHLLATASSRAALARTKKRGQMRPRLCVPHLPPSRLCRLFIWEPKSFPPPP